MPWTIDSFHSLVEFSVIHLGINIVKGRFREVQGTLELDPQDPTHSSVRAQVNTASIDTGVAPRDAHLRSADFFEVVKYPYISFESTSIQVVNSQQCIVHGNLTVRDVTRPVAFQTTYKGYAQDPTTGAWRIGLQASTIIDRRDFGVSNQPGNPFNTIVIGYEVRIDMNIEVVQG